MKILDSNVLKKDKYKAKLQALSDWDDYLLKESGLPGPRGNIELARVAGFHRQRHTMDYAAELKEKTADQDGCGMGSEMDRQNR